MTSWRDPNWMRPVKAIRLRIRCPLLAGFCDQGVLIGQCPNRPACKKVAAKLAQEDSRPVRS